jgi:hypothetical protein
MNCFNIRELQSILKAKYYRELLKEHSIKSLEPETRIKTNQMSNVTPEFYNFYTLGLTTNYKFRALSLTPNLKEKLWKSSFIDYICILTHYTTNYNTNFYYFLSSISISNNVLSSTYEFLKYLIVQIELLFNLPRFTTKNVLNNLLNFNFYNNNYYFISNLNIKKNFSQFIDKDSSFSYNSTVIYSFSQPDYMSTVDVNNKRFTKFYNPLVSYDYKCGHYLGI